MDLEGSICIIVQYRIVLWGKKCVRHRKRRNFLSIKLLFVDIPFFVVLLNFRHNFNGL